MIETSPTISSLNTNPAEKFALSEAKPIIHLHENILKAMNHIDTTTQAMDTVSGVLFNFVLLFSFQNLNIGS